MGLLPLALVACQASGAGYVVKRPGRPVVVLIGGLGRSQLKELGDAIALRCNVQVWNAGDEDAYRTTCEQLPPDDVGKKILIGHSFGADTADQMAKDGHVSTVILIDPIGRDRHLTPQLPYAWELYRPHWPDTHNELPHNPEFIDRIVARVNAMAG